MYLIEYLRRLLYQDLQGEEVKEEGHRVSPNDTHLLSKLQASGITLEKIDVYLAKLKSEPIEAMSYPA